jgi:hypothetical protein
MLLETREILTPQMFLRIDEISGLLTEPSRRFDEGFMRG